MKPGAYTQLHIQLVFAVKHRECLLHSNQRDELYKYVSGIIENKKCKSIIINGFSDYIHIFLGLNPAISISSLVHDIKISSTGFVNQTKGWFHGKFAWQEGYGAFTYGHSQVNDVFRYIQNQVIHHQKKPFREEYLEMHRKFEVKYDDRFLLEFLT